MLQNSFPAGFFFRTGKVWRAFLSLWVSVRCAQGQLKPPQQCIPNPVLQSSDYSPCSAQQLICFRNTTICVSLSGLTKSLRSACLNHSGFSLKRRRKPLPARVIEINRELEKKKEQQTVDGL